MLLAQLLHDPEEVAKRFNAELAPDEIKQIKHVASLRRVIDEYKINRDLFRKPIYYPIDKWWKKVISYHIIRYPVFYPAFYPVFNGGLDPSGIAMRSGRPLNPATTLPADQIFEKWRWRFYPRDILIRIDDRINELTRTMQELKQMRGGG